MQMDNVDLVVDSKTTDNAFNTLRTNDTEFGHIIVAWQSMLSSHSVNSRVELNRGQANVVVHALAS